MRMHPIALPFMMDAVCRSKDANEMREQVLAAQRALSALKELKRSTTAPTQGLDSPDNFVLTESAAIYSVSFQKGGTPVRLSSLLNDAEIIKGVESGLRFWDEENVSMGTLAHGFALTSLSSRNEFDETGSLSSFSDCDDDDFDAFEEEDDLEYAVEEDMSRDIDEVDSATQPTPATQLTPTQAAKQEDAADNVKMAAEYDNAACESDVPTTLLKLYEEVLDEFDSVPTLILPESISDVADPYVEVEDKVDVPADLHPYEACNEESDAPALLESVSSKRECILDIVQLEEYEEHQDAPALLPGCFV